MGPVTVPRTTDRATPLAELLLGWDCVELWVGNARAMAGFLTSAFGFRCTGFSGAETGVADAASYVVEQGDIRFVVTGALSPDSPIAAHVHQHGDGVHDLAWRVTDVAAAHGAAVDRGARSVRAPWVDSDGHGELALAQIATFGETVHTLVDRGRYPGARLAPGYSVEGLPNPAVGPAVGLTAIDHIVANVHEGTLADWVGFYRDVLGFTAGQHFDDDQIHTEYSALRSTVVSGGSAIVMPINEPAAGLRTSQIQEYLDEYRGPGVQHVALRTADIVATVAALRSRGVRFMHVPDTYYDDAVRRLHGFDLPWDELRRLNVLADRDERGCLLQIFTETITDRPTMFFEIIERRGGEGFGEGNFRALFEAIERDQARRGHL